MTVLGSLVSRPSAALQATAWGDWGDSGQTWAGANVTTQNALQLLTVYGCNRFIGDGISTLPVDALRKVGDRGVPIKTPGIIEEPAADLDFIAWSTQFLTSLILGGDFFGYRVYQGSTLSQVIPLDPTKCDVFRRQGRKWFRIAGEEYSTFEILHVPGIMWPGSDRGMSPVEAARQTIGQGMSAQEYAARFFDQDSTPGGVIEVPGELTPEQARDMARSWAKKHAGKSKNGLPGVLQGGAAWKQTSVTNEQAQFLETRKFTASEIAAQMFLIDPAEMGLPVDGSSLTYANLEQRNARKVQVTFLPWIVRLEKALSSMLPRPQYVKLNVNGLLRGDSKTRLEGYAIGIDKRFLTPNEARAFEDWAPLPGGDEFPPTAVATSAAPAAKAPTVLNVAPPGVTVNLPAHEVTVEPAVPDVVVNMPAVTAAVPDVVVNVPEAPPAVVNVETVATVPDVVVNVESPTVNVTNDVQPADVTVVDPPRNRRVVRDQFGQITEVIEE